MAAVFDQSDEVEDGADECGWRGSETSTVSGNGFSIEVDVDPAAAAEGEAGTGEGGVEVNHESEISHEPYSEGSGLEHDHVFVYVPGGVLDLHGEVGVEVVDGFGVVEGAGGILVGVGADVAHSESVDGHCWEINDAVDNYLAASWEGVKTGDDPRVGVLHCASDLALDVGCRFAGVVTVEDGAHGDSGPAVSFDGGYVNVAVRKLYLNGSSDWYHVLDFEAD